ncbi:MAG: protein kinase [Deltaproteobacteria bacterium]|nr:protein kinase [Deltaproteobacteria bacterium]
MAAKLARSQRPDARDPTPSSGGDALLKVGDLLAGKYRVERILGEGGMGVVVAAHHELLDQHVAVKLLYQDIADREAQSRLLLEARAAAKLQSEHVARVVDVDTGADGLPFIVMELLEGADLCQIADARGALPRWLVVDYVLQALEGLAHAHARGIVHRDLKPSNLFLSNRPDGTQIIKILDFGISKSTEQDSSKLPRRALQLTGGRAVLGSPPYMSPEQVRSPKSVDHRTDIWSLGIVMYELLTNSMPFGGDQIQETFAQILEKQPQPIRQIVSGVPEGLERVVMKCLSKNRDERYADVGELARALVPFGSGTWIQSADRIATTLVRAAEESQAARMAKPPPTSMDRLAIPSSPGKRIDSMQPELHGTASTVARRFTVFESRKTKAILGVAGFAALIGLLLLGGTLYRSKVETSPTPDPAAAASGEAPPEAVPGFVPMGAGVMTPAPHTVGGSDETPPSAPTGTVLGASPPPAATSIAPASSSAKKATPAAPPVVGRPAAPPPTPPRKPPTTPSATTTSRPLPAGLPTSRN